MQLRHIGPPVVVELLHARRDLLHPVEDLHLQSQRLGEGGSRLLRACQRGRVDRLDRFVGQPPRERGGLGQAVVGQPVARVGGVQPVVDVRLGFAVTDQEESHGLIVGGRSRLNRRFVPKSSTRPPRRRCRGTEGSRVTRVDAADVISDLSEVLYTSDQIAARVAEVAARIDADYAGRDILLVGVLNGAIMVVSDLQRAMKSHVEMDWMAISSYGSGTQSSGVVRILKDLGVDIEGRHVLVVEDIIDTGLTLSYLISNLTSRKPASLEIMTMFRKPGAARMEVPVKYVGFDIPNEFVVGYGLDYASRYRNLRDLAVLAPHVYS